MTASALVKMLFLKRADSVIDIKDAHVCKPNSQQIALCPVGHQSSTLRYAVVFLRNLHDLQFDLADDCSAPF
jgi:hypothetical protein